DISLDGPTSKSFTENVGQRFEAYGWEHILVKDGNDLEEVNAAIEKAKANPDQPSLIEVKTVIGFGSPGAGSHKVHGAPLGIEGVEATKKAYGWEGEDFYVPMEAQARFEEMIVDPGAEAEEKWNKAFEAYRQEFPELAQQFEAGFNGEL